MTEFIEREAAIEHIHKITSNIAFKNPQEAIDTCIAVIDCEPAADVEQVNHAHWVPEHREDRISEAMTYRNTRYYCSACGRALVAWEKPIDAPYCHCGAKMDEEPDMP